MKASLEFLKSFGVPDKLKQEVDDPTSIKIFDQPFPKEIIDYCCIFDSI